MRLGRLQKAEPPLADLEFRALLCWMRENLRRHKKSAPQSFGCLFAMQLIG